MAGPAPAAAGPDPRWLTGEEPAAWRGLASLMTALPSALDRQLREQAGISHIYYMILAMLSEAPDRALRMSELARITDTSASRLSHAVSALEERGWVERRQAPGDRRGQEAVLTDAGLEAVVATAPGHVAEVRRLVLDPLDEQEVRQLGRITAKILARLAEGGCG